MLKIKNTVTEMKNAFDRLISRLVVAEERISELDDIQRESMKTKKTKRTKTEGRKTE